MNGASPCRNAKVVHIFVHVPSNVSVIHRFIQDEPYGPVFKSRLLLCSCTLEFFHSSLNVRQHSFQRARLILERFQCLSPDGRLRRRRLAAKSAHPPRESDGEKAISPSSSSAAPAHSHSTSASEGSIRVPGRAISRAVSRRAACPRPHSHRARSISTGHC